ncbi:RDD family protein [Schlesneria sp. T3-172]|uniref:RDD family protein n=1 Tax=Schlesneria sphaerica TaxID=3373610 RepID=UPI0037C77442
MNSLNDEATRLEEDDFIPRTAGPPLYRRQDYVGATRHALIFAIDGFILQLICLILLDIDAAIFNSSKTAPANAYNVVGLSACLVVCWFYLAVLKPSRFRSPGYWITDARIVTIHGQPPSPWRMTKRLIWSVLSICCYYPVSIVTDLLWTAVEDERQMLRDLVFETRLIRNKAVPTGTGRISRRFVTAMGIVISYPCVCERVKAPPKT